MRVNTSETKVYEEMLSIKECMKRLGTSRSTTYKLLAHEPGVHRHLVPGSKKPVIRVEASVIDRLLRRSANPASSNAFRP